MSTCSQLLVWGNGALCNFFCTSGCVGECWHTGSTTRLMSKTNATWWNGVSATTPNQSTYQEAYVRISAVRAGNMQRFRLNEHRADIHYLRLRYSIRRCDYLVLNCPSYHTETLRRACRSGQRNNHCLGLFSSHASHADMYLLLDSQRD